MLSSSVSTIDLDLPDRISMTTGSSTKPSGKTSTWLDMASVLHRIGQTSSMFSVARALATRNWKPALLWWSAIAIFASVLIWQLSLIFMNYFSFGVKTVISESLNYSDFPAVTVCKTTQMNNLQTASIDWTTYSSSIDRLAREWSYQDIKDDPDKADVTYDDYVHALEYMRTLSSYYSALPLNLSLIESVDGYNPLVVSCDYKTWYRSPPNNCSAWVKSLWDPSYYKCYTISLPEEITKQVNEITVVLYLDDFNQPALTDGCCPSSTFSMSPGIRVAVHDRKVPPEMTKAIAVSPGTEMNVLISQLDRIRLPPPYPGNCTTTTKLGKTTDNMGYSSTGCEEICLQDLTIATCRCVDPSMAFTNQQLSSVNNSVCGNLTAINGDDMELSTSELWQMFEQIWCMMSTYDNKTFANCTTSCLLPCTERDYLVSTSASGQWPHPSFQLSFYEAYIRDKTYSGQFDAYEPILHDLNANNIKTFEAVERVQKLDLIQKNFIQLNVAFAKRHPYVISDGPSMTIDDLLSNVGGQFSLWLGMTVMVFVELFELIATAGFSIITSKKNKSIKPLSAAT